MNVYYSRKLSAEPGQRWAQSTFHASYDPSVWASMNYGIPNVKVQDIKQQVLNNFIW